MRSVWVMFGRFLRNGVEERLAIHCQGRCTPYFYRTHDEASHNLHIAYPAQCREDRLDGTRRWYVEDATLELTLIADDMQIPGESRRVILALLQDLPGSEQAFETLRCDFLAQHYPHLFTAK